MTATIVSFVLGIIVGHAVFSLAILGHLHKGEALMIYEDDMQFVDVRHWCHCSEEVSARCE